MSRVVSREELREAVYQLCFDSLFKLREDIREALEEAARVEDSQNARLYLQLLLQNAEIAERDKIPLTQEAGLPKFFIQCGSQVSVEGSSIKSAVEEGLQLFLQREPFRIPILKEPLNSKKIQKDRLPLILQLEQIPGDDFKIQCLRLDAESQRTSQIAVFSSNGLKEAITDFLLKSIIESQLRVTPPLFIGIGIGGTTAESSLLAQKALLRRMGKPAKELSVARIERELLNSVNSLGIGPGGIGGKTTALAVQIEMLPSLAEAVPVAIQIVGSMPCMADTSL